MPDSCTGAELRRGRRDGRHVTFNCGAAPITIVLSAEIPVAKDTVIDGGGKVTLSGGGKTRILHLASAWDHDHAASSRCSTSRSPTASPPTCPTPRTPTQGGAAIFRDGGSLDVIDCQFTHNHCASDRAGRLGRRDQRPGRGHAAHRRAARSRATAVSNGGAVGTLGENVTVVNSTLRRQLGDRHRRQPGQRRQRRRHRLRRRDIYADDLRLDLHRQHANAQGGAIFRVAYNDEPTTIDRCTFDGNSADPTTGLAGGLYLENTTITHDRRRRSRTTRPTTAAASGSATRRSRTSPTSRSPTTRRRGRRRLVRRTW